MFERAVEVTWDTIENMDIELEIKDNEIKFLDNKKGLADSKDIEEMTKLGRNKTCQPKT